MHKPRVSSKETIASAVEVTGSINRRVGGQNLTATVPLRAEPVDDQAGVTVEQGRFPRANRSPPWRP